MNKTKTKQLNELFNDWKTEALTWVAKQKSEDNYNRTFIKDGIVDEETFDNQPVKVLFISNEANIDNESIDSEKDDDIRNDFIIYNEREKDEYCDENGIWKTSKGRMRERVCCLYQVITRDFTNAKEPWEEALKFAYMNINKTGGGGKIDHRIKGFLENFSKELTAQINIINPELIVWLGCNTFDCYHSDLGVKKDNGVYYYSIKERKVPVIRMWHTSGAHGRGNVHEKFIDNKNDNKIDYKNAGKLATKLENLLGDLPENLKENGFTFEFEK